jgi:predicted dehydrogenase
MPRIQLGQIGVGHAHAAGKIEVYRQSNDYEVIGVVEPNAELRAAAQKQPQYAGLPFLDQDQLLSNRGVQVVAVETEVRDLLPTAEACIAAGKHIHLDKPPGDNLPRFRKLIEDASRQHLAIQLGYMYRFNPAILRLHQLLAEEGLGQIYELHTVMSKVVSDPARKAMAEYPGGMMFELGCHLIDLVVRILGKPQQVTPYYQHVGPQNDGLRDNMLAVCEYPQALATIKSSALEVDGFQRRHLLLCGTRGTCHIQPLDAPHIDVVLQADTKLAKKGRHRIEFGDYPRYVGDAAELAAVVRQERAPTYDYAHDLAAQETLLRACGLPVD